MDTLYDRIIIGGGIYGLYAAYQSASKGYKVLVLEKDSDVYSRSSLVNQARLHTGYHYPRSKETAAKSRDYFFRFMNTFYEAINTDFKQYYAISSKDSLTTAQDFVKFCDDLNIKCDKVDDSLFFKPGMVDGLYDTVEYAIDPFEMHDILLNKCTETGVEIKCNSAVENISYENSIYCVCCGDKIYKAAWLLNATYASTNQILKMLDLPYFDIKYEKCEVILCAVSKNIKSVGITVMDGPFFSIMPFGNTGLHSITSVCYTPHETSYNETPRYSCQTKSCSCDKNKLDNCNNCKYAPESKINDMLAQAKKYFKDDIKIIPLKSFFTVKPILNSCEKDDARPMIIKTYDKYPNFYTVFSGKLNTIFDLDYIL